MAAGTAHADTAVPMSTSWPENDLERSLVAAAIDNTKSSAFIRNLLNSEICALTAKPFTPDAANPDEKVALLAVKAPDGLPASPVFTSRHRATDVFGENQPVVCGKAYPFLDALRGSRVVVDPGQPFGIIYSADDLEHILGTNLEVSTPLQFQTPSDAPSAMVQKLKDVLAREPRITFAWLSLAYWPDKKEWSWYLDMETALDADTVHAMLRDTAREIDMLGRPLDTAINVPVEKPEQGIVLLRR